MELRLAWHDCVSFKRSAFGHGKRLLVWIDISLVKRFEFYLGKKTPADKPLVIHENSCSYT